MLKRTFLSLALAMTVLPLAACNDDDDDFSAVVQVPTQNITEIAADNDNFTTLTAALKAADLDDDLMSMDTEFTVFAPTDDAFTNLLTDLDISAEELLENDDLLKEILAYHVVAEAKVTASDIPFGDSIETLNGQAIIVNDDNSISDASGNMDSDLIQTDILATNGVVHAIDEVLIPSTDSIVELAMQTGNLSILVEAVVAAGLADTLSDEDANLTVLAPTNAAFADLLVELGVTKEQLLTNKTLLTEVLTYHVIDDRVFASEIMSGQQEMLNGKEITFDNDNVIQDLLGRKANIMATNIQANNGVVHTIDKVLRPQ